MNVKEIQGLYEAYTQVYEPEYISEEVEIAAEYFYEMGLNEEGIEILIEELGIDEFLDWIDEIVDEYDLTEARKLKKGERSLPGSTVRRLTGTAPSKLAGKARESVSKARQTRASATSAPTARQQRLQSLLASKSGQIEAGKADSAKRLSAVRGKAVSAAKKEQPKSTSTPTQQKSGIGGAIGRAFGAAVERGKKDIASVQQSYNTARQAGRDVEHRVRGGVRAVQGAAKAIRNVPQVRDARAAVTRTARTATRRAGEDIKKTAAAAGGALGTATRVSRKGAKPSQVLNVAAGEFAKRLTQKEEVEAWVYSLIDEGYDLSDYTWDEMFEIYESNLETDDLYDDVMEHLLDEGYANTVGDAEVIMANMSQEWFNDIVETLG